MPPSSTAIVSASDAQAFAAARAICRRNARDWFFAAAFLPKHKRDAICAVDAFCSMIRDALLEKKNVDAGCSDDSFNSRASLLRERLNDIYANHLELPDLQFRSDEQHVLAAMQIVVNRYQIPLQYFLDLIEGCRLESTAVRYATWTSLRKYCDHIGGAGARIVSCVLGLTHSDVIQNATRLGVAMQLTKILRAVKEDFARGIIFLPLEDLARFGYSERDLAGNIVNENSERLMQFEISRAQQLYRDGAEGICWLAGDGSRFAASLIAVVHAKILTKRVNLTFAQKVALFPRAWKLARREADEPLPNVFE
jgi:phytoene synthase